MGVISQIVTGKSVAATFSSGGTAALSTLGRIKVDNRSVKNFIAASNLSGGVDRTQGFRNITGYFWDYGDRPPFNNAPVKGGGPFPIFCNDTLDVAWTLDGLSAVQIASSGTGVRVTGVEVVVDPYEESTENAVYYIVHFGPMSIDITSTGTIPSDNSTPPAIYSTKSLGVQFAYWNTSTHALAWSGICYFSGMHLKMMALADPVAASCLNGIYYTPSGMIDFSLALGELINVWPLPVSPNVTPPMISGQPITSPFSGPGTVNGVGDLVFPDLDAVVGARMVTQLNSDLSPNSFWELRYAMLQEKDGEFDHKSLKPLKVNYVLQKCSSPVSKNNDTGWDPGAIIYRTGVATNGTGGTSYQVWP